MNKIYNTFDSQIRWQFSKFNFDRHTPRKNSRKATRNTCPTKILRHRLTKNAIHDKASTARLIQAYTIFFSNNCPACRPCIYHHVLLARTERKLLKFCRGMFSFQKGWTIRDTHRALFEARDERQHFYNFSLPKKMLKILYNCKNFHIFLSSSYYVIFNIFFSQ